ncbi:VOC family protein [Ottowia sp.]|uniref:VOC family protein n=1 Tax=Ottowia sp. TaxID=1898956 RepID=UPI0039E5FF3E
MDPALPLRSLDYTVIYARQMTAMREFYEDKLRLSLHRELSPRWIEYRIGSAILALASSGGRFNDPAPPIGALSLQLAFRVAPHEVSLCAETLTFRGVKCLSGPTDQNFGHRTLFFRDPDGNVLEIYAEIDIPRATGADENL